MGFQEKTGGISEDKLKNFLNAGKDGVMNEETETKESVTNLIGKAATFESNFKRQTYYVHNDLIKRLNKLTQKAPRGEKTKIINAALEQYLKSVN